MNKQIQLFLLIIITTNAQTVIDVDLYRIAEDIVDGPEAIAFDGEGKMYTANEDGRIIVLPRDGTDPYDFAQTEGRPLGLKFDLQGNLIVADAYEGLLSIDTTGEIAILSTECDSLPFLLTDDLDISSDGIIYFSDASSVNNLENNGDDWGEPNGRLLAYDPQTNETSLLLDGLYFANGVALSSDESFVLVNETLMYRIQKYWLKGDKAGTSEIFIENLPGFPDNVSSNEEGIFWVALFNPRNNYVEISSNKPFLRKIVLRLPELLQPQPVNHSFVLGLNEDGKVVHNLQYQANEAYSPITSVKQYNDTLYFGSLTHPGWGKIEVPK